MAVSAVIVQARCNSTRFPRKVLADLCGQPVLWHVLSRCRDIKGADMVILAVPDEAESDQIEVVADSLAIPIVRGSETDVLSRYLKAARWVAADYIMRVTADCPLIDPHVCGAVLDAVKRGDVDYASNVLPRTFEQGLDCEAFTRWALEVAARDAIDLYDREHVTPFLQRSNLFKRINIESGEPKRAEMNLCIDYPNDLERVAHYLCGEVAA
jgi:spore coat polysaccharide biosynthesis protein SpsF